MNKITYEERAKVYNEAMVTFGATTQLVVALEELSECQKEICKTLRGNCSASHLAEEVADATIMLEQVRQLFGINAMVCAHMDSKVLRLQHRIDEAQGRQYPDLNRIRNLFRQYDDDKTESGLLEED